MILALESSGNRCGAALWSSDWIGHLESDSALRHNELLLQHIQELLAVHKVGLANLRAVAVSSGPGSFTGLRVGLAVAKGLCWSLRLPLICVPTLEAYVHAIPSHVGRVLPLIFARADEVYWSLHEWEADAWTARTACRVSRIGALPDEISGKVLLCGEGYERHRDQLHILFGDRLMKIPGSDSLEPLIVSVARLAAVRFASSQFGDLFQAEPAYHYPFLPKSASFAGSGG